MSPSVFDPTCSNLSGEKKQPRFAKGEIFGLSFQEEWYVLGADDDFVLTAYVGNNLQDAYRGEGPNGT